MNPPETLDEAAERIAREIEAGIKAREIPLTKAEALLEPQDSLQEIKLACDSGGYDYCAVQNGLVLALFAQNASVPRLCLGTEVEIRRVGERSEARVRGPSGSVLMGGEIGTITELEVVDPSNPTGSHIVTVDLPGNLRVKVYPESVHPTRR